jgi:hypothetical protein
MFLLSLMIIITVLLGATVLFINGKVKFDRILFPVLILCIGNFVLLYAKFVVPIELIGLFLYIPAAIILFIAFHCYK